MSDLGRLPMRRILTSVVLLVFLLFPSLAFGETMDDLVVREGIHYKKFTEVPFTGKVTEKLLRGTFRNGKKHGPWVEYDRNRRVLKKVTYKNSKEDTAVRYSYHENGQLHYKSTYKDGERDGPWVRYYKDG